MIILFWLIFSIAIGYVASERGRSGWGFFALSVLLSPLVMAFVVIALPIREKLPSQRKPVSRRANAVGLALSLGFLVAVLGTAFVMKLDGWRDPSGARVVIDPAHVHQPLRTTEASP